MASLPSQHPTLSLHLADDALTPLITSSRSRAHLESLTSLATSALTSRTAASRVGMGAVERIMIEYPSPAAAAVVLQSYLHVPEPPSLPLSDADTTASSSTTTTTTTTMGGGKNLGAEDGEGEDQSGAISSPPRLVSVVVAGRPQDASEARRAAARLERIGREFQSQWSASSS